MIEDDAHVGHLFRRLLERMDCHVHLETSAPPALERIHSGERYELVISDIVLPGEMDGVDLLAAIRRRDPEQPVMLTTGYDRHALRDLPDELEGVDLLRKPFRRQDLEVLVGRLLA
ncbi:MAG: response regulator [Gammaproteobacteria bacterium]|nr:response regulator [Gammaproteobacteria bacterium]